MPEINLLLLVPPETQEQWRLFFLDCVKRHHLLNDYQKKHSDLLGQMLSAHGKFQASMLSRCWQNVEQQKPYLSDYLLVTLPHPEAWQALIDLQEDPIPPILVALAQELRKTLLQLSNGSHFCVFEALPAHVIATKITEKYSMENIGRILFEQMIEDPVSPSLLFNSPESTTLLKSALEKHCREWLSDEPILTRNTLHTQAQHILFTLLAYPAVTDLISLSRYGSQQAFLYIMALFNHLSALFHYQADYTHSHTHIALSLVLLFYYTEMSQAQEQFFQPEAIKDLCEALQEFGRHLTYTTALGAWGAGSGYSPQIYFQRIKHLVEVEAEGSSFLVTTEQDLPPVAYQLD